MKTNIKTFKGLADHQKKAVANTINKNRCIMVLPPGRGKTLIILTNIKMLFEKTDLKQAVIFTHKRGLESYRKNNFYNLNMKFFEDKEDFENLPDHFSSSIHKEVWVISTSMVTKYQDTILKVARFSFIEYIVYDEIHNIRVYKSKLATFFRKFFSLYKGQTLGATATPFYRDIEDIYSLFSYIYPALLGNWISFEYNYLEVKKREIWIKKRIYTSTGVNYVRTPQIIGERIGYKNVEKLYNLISPYMYVDMSTSFEYELIRSDYSLVKKDVDQYMSLIAGEGLDTLYTFKLKRGHQFIDSLVKSSGESFFTENGLIKARDIKIPYDVLIDKELYNIYHKEETEAIGEYVQRLVKVQLALSKSDSKILKLFSILDKAENGCLIYFAYIESLEFVADVLKRNFPDRQVICLTGGDSKLESKISKLRDNDIVCLTRVATQSLDFYSDSVVIYEPITSPGLLDQFIGRVSRMNSKHNKIYIHFLIGDMTIEEYFLERLKFLSDNIQWFPFKDKIPHGNNYEAIVGKAGKLDISVLKKYLLWQEVKI